MSFAVLERLAAECGAEPGDKSTPVAVPAEHRETARHLWGIGLLTLNASPDRNGEYFSQAVLTPLAHPTNAFVLPVCPVGDVASRVDVVGPAGNALLITSNAGADLASLSARRSSRLRFEIRDRSCVSHDHNEYGVLARLDLARAEVESVSRWGTEVAGVIVDAALNRSSAPATPCACDLEDEEHVVVADTEPEQDDADIALIGARVRIALTPVAGDISKLRF